MSFTLKRIFFTKSNFKKIFQTTLINFIDLRASPAIPQLIYELLFGLPENFNLPFFSQPFYQLNLALPVKINGKQKVLARMEAISPTNKQIKYSLLTTQMNSTLSIVPSTGVFKRIKGVRSISHFGFEKIFKCFPERSFISVKNFNSEYTFLGIRKREMIV